MTQNPNPTGHPGEPGEPGGPGEGSQGSGNPGSDEAGGTQEPDPGQPNDPQPAPECQEGQVDEDCHAFPDGTSIVFPGGVPIGNCKAGVRVCSGGKWGSCEGAIPPKNEDDCEIKNDDSDCDGVPNAGCDCVTGETRECGHGNVGACKLGEQRCVDGKWDDECVGAVYPEPERCDGKKIDEDCDGTADIADSECDCIDDEQAYCPRAGQKGDCKWGQKTCVSGKWGGCDEWAKPQPEVCGSREAVAGVEWTGDEDCDGGIDTSPVGKKGPAGCVNMMLDQDGDSYGKLGPDLSEIRNSNQISLIGTACLCPARPDIAKKQAEGWVRSTHRANQDCGDCRAGMDGGNVFPGNRSTATFGNRCLTSLNWQITMNNGRRSLGDFDLNCDGRHTDPSNHDGRIDVIQCRKSGPLSCAPATAGRLIPQGSRGIWCGGTFTYGRCEAIIEEIEVEGHNPAPFDDTATGGGPTTTSKPKPKKKKQVFRGCRVEPDHGRHTIRCQ